MSNSISKRACAGLFASATGQKDEIENAKFFINAWQCFHLLLFVFFLQKPTMAVPSVVLLVTFPTIEIVVSQWCFTDLLLFVFSSQTRLQY